MFFSEYFDIDSKILEEYGTVDISLVCDIPLFVDPMLIFNSQKPEYKILHDSIISYFHFLSVKSSEGVQQKDLEAWFRFPEIPNNWFGYSLTGNKGSALGKNFAEFLSSQIGFIIQESDITKDKHIEKALLIYDGSGKDNISDLTVNLIKGYLLEYTEKFALKFIDSKKCFKFPVDKAYFNYDTESFVTKEYTLPFIQNEKGNIEYVLLTPIDILRKDEPTISRRNFIKNHDKIRESISNEALKTIVNNYINLAVTRYEKKQRANKKTISKRTIKKIEKDEFLSMVNSYPELYDYYIKLCEDNPNLTVDLSNDEVLSQLTKFIENTGNLSNLFLSLYSGKEYDNSFEEAKYRIKFFKHIIEDCDGYKNLYYNGERITQENDLQRLFKLVWARTTYQVDSESNNGRGQTDFIISKGNNNMNIIEFKLASNSQLSHVFEQVEIYENANKSKDSLIVIFYFNEAEYDKIMKILTKKSKCKDIDDSIFLIDCRNDNKTSASKV